MRGPRCARPTASAAQMANTGPPHRRAANKALGCARTSHLMDDGTLNDQHARRTTMDPTPQTETATFAAGCFWCLQSAFSRLRGVAKAEAGYSNGHHPRPTYEDVCTGTSGHAEVVQVTFDPSRITYVQLLKVFFSLHDPTSLNRQGQDVGTQYRSAIFTHSPQQVLEARTILDELQASHAYSRPIVTALEPLDNYHAAEPVHQDYFDHHPHQGYCMMVVAPKLEAFEHSFAAWLRQAEDPQLRP